MKYIVRLLDLHLIKHETDVLPLVIPFVIYNGEVTYSYSMDLFSLFPPELREQAKHHLIEPYPLLDLSRFDTREVKDDAWISLLFNALKYGSSKKLTPRVIVQYMEISLMSLAAHGDLGYIECIIRYLHEVQEANVQEELWQVLQQKLQPVLGERFMMSIADALRQEGMQQGMQQGMHLAKLEDARAMLVEGIALEKVARITKLSTDELRHQMKGLGKNKHRY